MSSLSADFCWCAYAVAEIAHTDVSIRRTMSIVSILYKGFIIFLDFIFWNEIFENRVSVDEKSSSFYIFDALIYCVVLFELELEFLCVGVRSDWDFDEEIFFSCEFIYYRIHCIGG